MTSAPSNTGVSYGRPGSILLFASVTLLATGMELGGNLQPARVLIAAGLLWSACAGRLLRDRSDTMRAFLAMSSFWLVWGLASLAWTPDFEAGLTELAGVALGILTVVVVTSLAWRVPSAPHWLRRGWVLAFLLTLPIAFHEILTDQHLPSSYGQLSTGGSDSFAIVYAAATFGNRNTYAAFLVLVFPFLVWQLERTKGACGRLLVLAMAVTVLALVLLAATRLGIISIAIEITAWLCLNVTRRAFRGALLSGVLLLGLAGLYSEYLPYTRLRFEGAISGNDQSIDQRSGLFTNGIQFVAETAGFGVGAGGYSSLVRTGAGYYNTGGQINPHNVWIQIASQYGIYVGLAFVCWLLYCFIATAAVPEAVTGRTHS